MRRALIVAREGAPHHLSFGNDFAAGLKRRGWYVEVSTSDKPCDLLVTWGVRDRAMIQRQRAAGGEVCILERGYVGDRMRFTSVSFGGELNGRAIFRVPAVCSLARFYSLGLGLEPWRDKPSGYALIMGQVPGDQSIRHVNIDRWYADTAAQLTHRFGWDVCFRPHPLAKGSRRPDLPDIQGSLADALAGAGLVVTFNSNSGVDAVLAGVPTVAMDPGSMVREVAAHDIAVIKPQREAWAARLAWCQYSREEFRSGFAAEACGL